MDMIAQLVLYDDDYNVIKQGSLVLSNILIMLDLTEIPELLLNAMLKRLFLEEKSIEAIPEIL